MSDQSQSLPVWEEADRLAALDSYRILDTAKESDFDDLVKVAAQICGVPMALISLVDSERQWFKAALGLDAAQTPREVAFCAHAIQQSGTFTVADTALDPRFSANPLVTGDPNLRFYSGAPLVTPDGFPLGTLCVLDTKPRQLTTDQTFALEALARQVMVQLELRKALAEQRRAESLRLLLVQELQHRVKNTLSMVQAITHQALRNATSFDVARSAIADRLVAMASAHDLLTAGNWSSAQLRDVVEAAITNGGLPAERYQIKGADVDLGPRAALGVALALHELNTNATKFGALSNTIGVVHVTWRLEAGEDGEWLALQWRESGGPAVQAPKRRGFGSRLIASALASEIEGVSKLDYPVEGVIWTFRAPLRALGKLSM